MPFFTKQGIDKAKEHEIRTNLKSQGLSSSEIDSAIKKLNDAYTNEPLPKIAIIGFTGVGKSTTLNALFNAGQPTSDIRACTQKEAEIIGDVSKYTGSKGSIIIYDMPGIGEDISADERHFETYKRVLPLVDVVIWTFHTGDRAMTPTQEALKKLVDCLGKDFTRKLMFVINKADAIAPGEADWDVKLNAPSALQRKNINELESYVRQKIRQVLPYLNVSIVTYSAKRRFRLEQLMEKMVETVEKSRRWILDSMADVASPTDLIDPRLLALINENRKNSNF